MTGPGGRGGPQLIPRPPDVVAGGPPPWADHIGSVPDLPPEAIRGAFGAFGVERAVGLASPDLRRSAVAAVLSWTDRRADGPATPEVLLTRRAWTMRTHRGEIAFAGGAEDPGDDFPVGTALREATEEVGLDPSTVEVVGALDPLTTFTSDRVVVPVVVITARRPEVVRSPLEVDGILHVPIAELLHPDCYHQELWTWRELDGLDARRDHPMHFFDLDGDTVWGATAAMLAQMLTVLFAPSPGR